MTLTLEDPWPSERTGGEFGFCKRGAEGGTLTFFRLRDTDASPCLSSLISFRKSNLVEKKTHENQLILF